MKKQYTDNQSYNKYLYNIAHTYDIETLEAMKFDISCDVEIDTFDMANNLGNLIDEKIAILN